MLVEITTRQMFETRHLRVNEMHCLWWGAVSRTPLRSTLLFSISQGAYYNSSICSAFRKPKPQRRNDKIHISKWKICVVTEDSSFPSPGSGSQGMNRIKKIILGYYCFSLARLPLILLQDPRRPRATKAGLWSAPWVMEWSMSVMKLSGPLLRETVRTQHPRDVYCFRILLLGLASIWTETAVDLSDTNWKSSWFLFSFSSAALGGKLEKFVLPAGIGGMTAITTTLSFSKRRL